MTYTDDNRGVIQYRDRARQIVNFKNIRFGNITPTDCDGEIEYHNKAWIFFEIKYRNAELPRGQRLAIERKVDDVACAKKLAIAIVAEHYVNDTSADIDAETCIVREFYFQRKWKNKTESQVLLGDLIRKFLNWVDEKK